VKTGIKRSLPTAVMVAVALGIGMMSSTAFAIGYQADIKTTNDTFENKGKIIGVQVTNAGAGNLVVAQRARSLQLDAKLTYTSTGNTYKNSGTISGNQITNAGAGNMVVAQEAY
jgi:hypothetical protein